MSDKFQRKVSKVAQSLATPTQTPGWVPALGIILFIVCMIALFVNIISPDNQETSLAQARQDVVQPITDGTISEPIPEISNGTTPTTAPGGNTSGTTTLTVKPTGKQYPVPNEANIAAKNSCLAKYQPALLTQVPWEGSVSAPQTVADPGAKMIEISLQDEPRTTSLVYAIVIQTSDGVDPVCPRHLTNVNGTWKVKVPDGW